MVLAHPQNESREHYVLKRAAIEFLVSVGCYIVAPEVGGMTGDSKADMVTKRRRRSSYFDTDIVTVEHKRSIADAVGIKRESNGDWDDETGQYLPRWTIKLVEAKASRRDFEAGYCTGGDHNYVIAPPGMIDPDELVPGVGLLEADPAEAQWVDYWDGCRWNWPTVHVRRRPKLMGNRDRSDRPVDVLDLIARRLFSMWYYPNAHTRAEAALRAPGGGDRA